MRDELFNKNLARAENDDTALCWSKRVKMPIRVYAAKNFISLSRGAISVHAPRTAAAWLESEGSRRDSSSSTPGYVLSQLNSGECVDHSWSMVTCRYVCDSCAATRQRMNQWRGHAACTPWRSSHAFLVEGWHRKHQSQVRCGVP